MSRSGGARAPDDQTKLKKQLNELMKLEENKFCADCGCVDLAGPPSTSASSSVSRVRDKEMWIRDKYERKRFAGEAPRESEDRGARRKKHSSSEEEEEQRQRRKDKERTNSRHGSRTASREATPTQPAVTKDILTFDVFSAPAPASKPAPSLVDAAPVAAAPKQDEWASFGGSSNAQAGFKDAFAPQSPAPADQHVNKMANIMASFGSSTQPQQQQNAFPPQQQQNAFPPQQGMAPAPMMGMQMNGMNG
ncbi:hypothetical protein GQ600_23607 [Phytophthora cactorum]|nr:hypothetical protein GQ600_23607 [Phytophthora cactorum]